MSKPTLEMKWNQYNFSNLYLLSKDRSELIVIYEGDGSNLFEEDKERGYVDYWLSDSYNTKTGEEDKSNQLLEEKYISDYDYTIAQVIERNEYCADDYILLDPELGEELEGYFIDAGQKILRARLLLERTFGIQITEPAVSTVSVANQSTALPEK